MNKKLLPLAICVALSACASPGIQQTARNDVVQALDRTAIANAAIAAGAEATVRGSSLHADKIAAEQAKMPVLRRSKSAFIGTQMVPVTNDDRLPTIFKRDFTLEFDDKKAGRFVPLTTVATRLTAITGVPVRIHPDVTTPVAAPGASAGAAAPVPAPVIPGAAVPPIPSMGAPAPATPAMPVPPLASGAAPSIALDAGEMKWRGTLTGFLNNLTDRLGLAWEYRDNTVVIMRYVTESHEVATFAGSTGYSMSTGGNSTGNGGTTGSQTTATANLEINEAGRIDPIATIEKTIEKMIATVPGSSVTRSDGSGRLLVKTTREMQSQVRDFIKAENTTMLRQAQIQFDIYSVRTDDTNERGINWDVLFSSLSGIYGLNMMSPTSVASTASGSVGLNILAGGSSETSRKFGNSSVIVNLLNQLGTNVQHRPVSLLALNRTWARKSRLNTEGYLAETTPGPASTTGVGAPGLKTDKVTTGDQYVAQPQILDNNTVLLKFGVSLSDLLGLFDVTVGTGLTQQKVQTPRIQSINDQYSIKLEPGQVMAITGLSRQVTTTDQRTLAEGTSIWLGGGRRATLQREHFVIFVRPVIL